MNYIKNGPNFTVVINDRVYTFGMDHPNYGTLVECIKTDNEDLFIDSISIGQKVQKWSKGGFEFRGGILFYQDRELNPVITELVRDMIEEGFDETPILNFMANLYENPSNTAVEGLYDWLKHRSLAITGDGYFLAYKYIAVYEGDQFVDKMGRTVNADDYVDSHSQTYRNNVGDTNKMPRNAVNDNRSLACESGFHIGTLDYVKGAKHIVICKINPKDVVSIPMDSNCQKIRCCEYSVVSEYRELGLVE